MIKSILVKYKGAVANDGSFSRRAWMQLMAFAWEQVGRKWHLEMRPKHFTKEGAQKYHYTPRQGEQTGTAGRKFWSSYTGQKMRKFGHTLPLVYTGDTRFLTRTANIKATSRGVKITYVGVSKLTYPRKAHATQSMFGRKTLADDFLYVPASEIEELNRTYQITLSRLLRTFNGSSTRRIG